MNRRSFIKKLSVCFGLGIVGEGLVGTEKQEWKPKIVSGTIEVSKRSPNYETVKALINRKYLSGWMNGTIMDMTTEEALEHNCHSTE